MVPPPVSAVWSWGGDDITVSEDRPEKRIYTEVKEVGHEFHVLKDLTCQAFYLTVTMFLYYFLQLEDYQYQYEFLLQSLDDADSRSSIDLGVTDSKGTEHFLTITLSAGSL